MDKIMEYQSAMEGTYASAGPDRRTWWSGRRRRYNVSLIVAAPVSVASQVAVWGLFEERLPCVEITGFSIGFGGVLFLLGLGAANIFYFLGPFSEIALRPRQPLVFRRWAYRLGLSFSLLLIFLPALTLLIAGIFGPLPCTDKFGVRHAFDPAAKAVHPAEHGSPLTTGFGRAEPTPMGQGLPFRLRWQHVSVSVFPPAHRRYSDGSPDNEPVFRRRVRHNAQQDIESLVTQTLRA